MFKQIVILISLCLFVSSCTSHPDFPPGMVVIEELNPGRSNEREVFILLPEENFTAEAVKRIIAEYRPQCRPQGLNVIIFSDPELLRKRIEFAKIGDSRDFTQDERGRNAAKMYYQQTRWPEGTFIAEYRRFLDVEDYEYRLSREAIEPTTVKFDTEQNPYQCQNEGNRKARPE